MKIEREKRITKKNEFKMVQDEIYRCFPKKHIPILFHNWAELGV